ncbi:MAG: hypothetical protein V1804_01740, partial [Patescibacteria group bacterium]
KGGAGIPPPSPSFPRRPSVGLSVARPAVQGALILLKIGSSLVVDMCHLSQKLPYIIFYKTFSHSQECWNISMLKRDRNFMISMAKSRFSH